MSAAVLPDVRQVVAYRVSDRGIGCRNELLYRLSGDLRHFRLLTREHIVLMGRQTWDSLGQKPLPQRINVVLSRTLPAGAHQGAYIFSDLDAALSWCHYRHADKIVFVIGGGELYRATLARTRQVYATEIVDTCEAAPDCDSTYPELDLTTDFSRHDTLVPSVTETDLHHQRPVEYTIRVFLRERWVL